MGSTSIHHRFGERYKKRPHQTALLCCCCFEITAATRTQTRSLFEPVVFLPLKHATQLFGAALYINLTLKKEWMECSLQHTEDYSRLVLLGASNYHLCSLSFIPRTAASSRFLLHFVHSRGGACMYVHTFDTRRPSMQSMDAYIHTSTPHLAGNKRARATRKARRADHSLTLEESGSSFGQHNASCCPLIIYASHRWSPPKGWWCVYNLGCLGAWVRVRGGSTRPC